PIPPYAIYWAERVFSETLNGEDNPYYHAGSENEEFLRSLYRDYLDGKRSLEEIMNYNLYFPEILSEFAAFMRENGITIGGMGAGSFNASCAAYSAKGINHIIETGHRFYVQYNKKHSGEPGFTRIEFLD